MGKDREMKLTTTSSAIPTIRINLCFISISSFRRYVTELGVMLMLNLTPAAKRPLVALSILVSIEMEWEVWGESP
jgi:hypothetical protein